MKTVNVNGTEPVEVISAGNKSVAVICIGLCNYGNGDSVIDIYVCENGNLPPKYDENGNLVSGDESSWFIRELLIKPKDTFMLNLEKLLLHPGDKIYIRKYDENMKLTTIISYEEY